MFREREQSTACGCLGLALVVLVGTPLAYVLGIGPISWLNNHNLLAIPEWLVSAYRPVTYLCEICPPFAAVIGWYQLLI